MSYIIKKKYNNIMITLTKKYRLFWITETKEILNDYEYDFSGSVTSCSDSGPNYHFESDDYQDILDKINTEDLKKQEVIFPTEPPIN